VRRVEVRRFRCLCCARLPWCTEDVDDRNGKGMHSGAYLATSALSRICL